jgi:hypothetical protein
MSTFNRVGKRWSVNEVLALQREFELLGWSIDQIAKKHQRSPTGIMYKLDQEGFADYNILYSNYHDLNSHILDNSTSNQDSLELECVSSIEDDVDEAIEEDEPMERIFRLESAIEEIKNMLKVLTTTVNTNYSTLIHS